MHRSVEVLRYLQGPSVCSRAGVHAGDVDAQAVLSSTPDHQTQRATVVHPQAHLQQTADWSRSWRREGQKTSHSSSFLHHSRSTGRVRSP